MMISLSIQNNILRGLLNMSNKRKRISLKEKFVDHIVGIIFTGILCLLSSLSGLICMIYNMNNNIGKLLDTTNNLNSRLTFIDGPSKESLLNRFNKLETHLNTKEKLPYEIESESMSDENNNASYLKLHLTKIGLKNMDLSVSTNGQQKNNNLNWDNDSEDFIAEDSSGKKKYKCKNLVDKRILLPYKEGNQEVYFLGQYNKNNHWDGLCIVNVFINNKLELINELEYDNGKLIKYEQIFSDDETWVLGNRHPKKNYNMGYSYTYFKNKDYIKEFSLKSVELTDILRVDKFSSKVKKNGLDGYYCGRTKNGLYNDKTGHAYLVKYNKKGKIRLFYCGKFKNGMQEDFTGKAWDIVLGRDNKYYFRTACYSNNKILYKTMTKHKDALSGKEAEKKLKEKLKNEFNNLKNKCKLTWKKE